MRGLPAAAINRLSGVISSLFTCCSRCYHDVHLVYADRFYVLKRAITYTVCGLPKSNGVIVARSSYQSHRCLGASANRDGGEHRRISERTNCENKGNQVCIILFVFALVFPFLSPQFRSKRARRVLEARLPKLVESHKQAMLIRGGKSSEIINEVLKDLHFLKSPHAVRLNRHNHILPFEVAGRESLEFLAKKNDCSLMAFGYHQKKRPHSLIFARFFAYQLLQMIEVGITGYVPIFCFDVCGAMFPVGHPRINPTPASFLDASKRTWVEAVFRVCWGLVGIRRSSKCLQEFIAWSAFP